MTDSSSGAASLSVGCQQASVAAPAVAAGTQSPQVSHTGYSHASTGGMHPQPSVVLAGTLVSKSSGTMAASVSHGGSANVNQSASVSHHAAAQLPIKLVQPAVVNTTAQQHRHVPSQHPRNDAVSKVEMLSRQRLQELVKQVDPSQQLDEDVEQVLLQLADDFIETTANAACLLAKHRKSTAVDVKDVQLYLERNWSMKVPGFGSEEIRAYKRSGTSEAHKQRVAIIRKALKKY